MTDGRGGEAAMAAAPKVFQIYYEDWQRSLCDPRFAPLDNRGPATEYLEFDLFERLSISPHVAGAALWGALSWRFTEKTGLDGDELFALIAADPGHDVYFCNPHPQNEGVYHNLWMQGETAHPRFIELSRAFLVAAGLPGEEVDLIETSAHYSCANYFIATPAFWSAYLPFVRGAIRRADANLSAEDRAALHSTAADERNVHKGCTYMPFIVERLFPLFMRTAGRHLTGHKLPLPVPEEDLDVHQRLLREMKDNACRQRSQWLAACWVNYRGLYLQQRHGAQWARRYLRAVTPGAIRFA
ncbi:MAG: hypothetical protein ABW173_11740 [Sphingomonas sp.]